MPILLFFAHGMQVEVPEGTVLRFHPTSHSPDELSRMLTVEFHVGGIIFETKEVVLEKVPGTFFYTQHAHELHIIGQHPTHQHDPHYHHHELHIGHRHVDDYPDHDHPMIVNYRRKMRIRGGQ